MSTLITPLLLNTVLEILASAKRQEKEIKSIQLRIKEEIFSIYKQHDFLCRVPRNLQRSF